MANRIVALVVICLISFSSIAQVNSVEYGNNRIQHKKFIWKFYQSPNFNTYFNQGGLELGKYVAQVAEQELPSIEAAVEYSLQRQINIVIDDKWDAILTANFLEPFS